MAINKEYETTVNLIGDSQGITISSATVSHVQVAAVSFLAGPKGNQGDPATNLVTSVNDKQGSVTVTKTDTGLGNVDNTSDLDKPVSTATQTALGAKVNVDTNATRVYINNTAGVPTTNAWSDAPAADTFARRTTGGQLRVGTAVLTDAATTKAQMDTADALKVNKAGDTMTGRLQNSTSNMAISNTRGGKEILFGASSVGNFTAYDNTNGVEFFNAMSDGSGIRLGTSAGVAYLKGTGFPNGVASAPVGSIYIDTNITNGASSWIKKSGTGNTGWQVLEGDTGWLDITSVFSAAIEVVNPNDYGAWIRRTNQTVQLSIKAQSKYATWAGQSATMPDGFKFDGGSGKPVSMSEAIQVSGSGRGQVQISGVAIFVSSTGITTSTRFYLTVTGATSQTIAWPTTLPGTAV